MSLQCTVCPLFQSCLIHDLCYVPPNMTKAECDQAMRTNIDQIYCSNVHPLERDLCRARAEMAMAVLGMTDQFFEDSRQEREGCEREQERLPSLKGVAPGVYKKACRAGYVWVEWKKKCVREYSSHRSRE